MEAQGSAACAIRAAGDVACHHTEPHAASARTTDAGAGAADASAGAADADTTNAGGSADAADGIRADADIKAGGSRADRPWSTAWHARPADR